jgi:hypothetical protein
MHRLLVVALVAGCSPTSYTFSPMFARGPSPKPEGCAFDVVSLPPDRGYDQVGTLTFYNGTSPRPSTRSSASSPSRCAPSAATP